MSAYDQIQSELVRKPRRWTVTGAAGFIGSHLTETLLGLGQEVVGMDNFATGHRHNLDSCEAAVGSLAWSRFRFVEGDIRDPEACNEACNGSDYLLHQAALGSVPRSIADPATSTSVNIGGFVNILSAARDAGIQRTVYASSSSVYGDDPDLPKKEEKTGTPLSPYAVTKCANELYASVFGSTYGMEIVGLRYFNVFGPRQDPQGAYAAVIPRWIATIQSGEECTIFGDGETSRDFSFVANVVQGNLLAATHADTSVCGEVVNIAAGGRTTLRELYGMIHRGIVDLAGDRLEIEAKEEPHFEDFRKGDVKHSHADVSKAKSLLGYEATHSVDEGLRATLAWYLDQ